MISGRNRIDVVITAEDTRITYTYTLTVIKPPTAELMGSEFLKVGASYRNTALDYVQVCNPLAHCDIIFHSVDLHGYLFFYFASFPSLIQFCDIMAQLVLPSIYSSRMIHRPVPAETSSKFTDTPPAQSIPIAREFVPILCDRIYVKPVAMEEGTIVHVNGDATYNGVLQASHGAAKPYRRMPLLPGVNKIYLNVSAPARAQEYSLYIIEVTRGKTNSDFTSNALKHQF
jgi:hypothetical protein